jgi:acetolactate synthase small subunit
MNIFHIQYRKTQGTLMRILNAASRRAIEMPYVQAEPADAGHQVTLLLDVNAKQLGQLCRDWHAIVDVVDVRAGVPAEDMADITSNWVASPHPPASAGVPRDVATGAAMA